MIYEPLFKLGNEIQNTIGIMGGVYGYHPSMNVLKSIGRPAVHFVLKTIEDHPLYPHYHHWNETEFACMTLLKWYAEQDMMTLDQLQRYRRILTAEKKHVT